MYYHYTFYKACSLNYFQKYQSAVGALKSVGTQTDVFKNLGTNL